MKTKTCNFVACLWAGVIAFQPACAQVSISIQPENPPIQIHPTGGSFDYALSCANLTSDTLQAEVWCDAMLPGGQWWGPTLGPISILIPPEQTLSRLRNQIVPANAPAGSYTYYAYAGEFPNAVWDSDSLFFEKLPVVGGMELWVTRYGDAFYDAGLTLAIDAQGNVYVGGMTSSDESEYDFLTIKYDPSGVEQWSARYTVADGSTEELHCLALDSRGNVYVAGRSNGFGTDYDLILIKYAPSGALQWVARHNGTANDDDGAEAIAVDAMDNVYVTGYSSELVTNGDYLTIKYDSSGTRQWITLYNYWTYNNGDHANAIVLDSVGNAYVTGGSSNGNAFDYATIMYDSTGNQCWVVRYNDSGNLNDMAVAIGRDLAGNIYVTGESWSGSLAGIDFVTIKYDANGVQQWLARYNGPASGEDAARCMVVNELGNAYVSGYSAGAGSNDDYATLKYNTDGITQWIARYNGTGNNRDWPFGLDVDQAGNVYVTGSSWGAGTEEDYATVKYNAFGHQQWAARYDGGCNEGDNAFCLKLDSEGNAYVTGRITYFNQYWTLDCATIKYAGGDLYGWIPATMSFMGITPEEFELEQNHPNPFNASTSFRFNLPQEAQIDLRIYNQLGQEVAAVAQGWRQAGWHEVTFDARNLASGIYIFGLKAGDFKGYNKMVLTK
jgi:hypothetical protein